MSDLGVSFSPTNQPSYGSQAGNNRPGASPVSPVQDAIKLLSFRLPTVLGASAITPGANLAGPSPFGTQLGSAIAENFLRRLMGQPGAGMAQGGAGVPSAPPFNPSSPLPVTFTPSQSPTPAPTTPLPTTEEPPSAPQAPPTGGVGLPGGFGTQTRQY